MFIQLKSSLVHKTQTIREKGVYLTNDVTAYVQGRTHVNVNITLTSLCRCRRVYDTCNLRDTRALCLAEDRAAGTPHRDVSARRRHLVSFPVTLYRTKTAVPCVVR